MIGFQVRAVCHAALLQNPGLRLIFLTLTVPNVSGDCIGAVITDLYGAYQRLLRIRAVKAIAIGYFRALEVKYSRKRGDFHPRLHVLLVVPEQYFKTDYIDRQQWLAYWRQAARNPLITQVDVRAVKPKRAGNDRIGGAAAEVSKYSVTAKDLIQSSPAETARVVRHLYDGLKNRRLAQFGGFLGKVKKQLKLVDAERATSKELVAVGDDPNCRCSMCQVHLEAHVYRWLGGRNGDYVG